MTTTLPKVRRSNRRGVEAQARVRAMQDAALLLMVRHGYEGASLDEILRRSGGSKATLIKYFRNKAGLLASVITNVADECIAEAQRAAQPPDPQAALRGFGEVLLRFYLRPDSLVIYRGVVAAGPRHRRLAQIFYTQGHGRFVTALAKRLANWHGASLLDCPDPHGDADRFLHMIRSGWHERRMIGLIDEVPAAGLRRHVHDTVRLFLQGVSNVPIRRPREFSPQSMVGGSHGRGTRPHPV